MLLELSSKKQKASKNILLNVCRNYCIRLPRHFLLPKVLCILNTLKTQVTKTYPVTLEMKVQGVVLNLAQVETFSWKMFHKLFVYISCV